MLNIRNLKLGYGGTQSEMARLINESGVLGDSMKVTAETVKDVPFDQMILAINKTQERMGIMGTTSKEASATIEGSTNSMKAAWQNMLTGMADENANFEQLATNFIGTLITEDGKGGVLGTLIPRITQVITGMSEAIATGLPQVIQAVVPLIQENLPIILNAVQQALQTIVGVLPTIIDAIAPLIPQIVQMLISMLPQLIDVGVEILLSLINGLIQSLPKLVAMVPRIITTIVSTLINNLPQIIQGGVQILASLISGMMQNIGNLALKVKELGQTIINKIKEFPSKMLDAGKNLVKGLWEGITGSLDWIKSKIKGWVGNVTKFIKKLFGISSPSKLFADEIGTNLALGIGEGFGDEMANVSKEMANSIPTSFDTSISTGVSGSSGSMTTSNYYELVDAFKEALGEMKIELDDENMGKFIDKTVARTIYS